MSRDPYSVLGVTRQATEDEIKAAWEVRVTAAAQAADLAQAKEVDAAYEVLRDRRRRDEFDRTGVVPQQRRIAPDERLVAPAPFRMWSPAEGPRAARPRRDMLFPDDDDLGPAAKPPMRKPVVAIVVLVALLLTWVGFAEFSGSDGDAVARHRLAAGAHDLVQHLALFTSGDVRVPAVHVIPSPHRQLSAVPPPAGSGGYRPFAADARWDPCQPIHYVINGSPPFAQGDRLLQSAIAEVSRVSGLRFINDGATSERPTAGRKPYDPARYGDTWSPVLIAWTDSTTVHRLDGDVLGVGGADPMTLRGHSQLVTGLVYFDGPQVARLLFASHGGAALARAVMLHELGHLVGLGHVHDTTSVMNPRLHMNSPRDYSTADLRGLAWAGSGPCLPYVAGN